jgi:hypothetical protein
VKKKTFFHAGQHEKKSIWQRKSLLKFVFCRFNILEQHATFRSLAN